jgi:hypothetical protein
LVNTSIAVGVFLSKICRTRLERRKRPIPRFATFLKPTSGTKFVRLNGGLADIAIESPGDETKNAETMRTRETGRHVNNPERGSDDDEAKPHGIARRLRAGEHRA